MKSSKIYCYINGKIATSDKLFIDITIDPGANPNSRTGGGKTTVIAPLVEALMIDDGIPVMLADEARKLTAEEAEALR